MSKHVRAKEKIACGANRKQKEKLRSRFCEVDLDERTMELAYMVTI